MTTVRATMAQALVRYLKAQVVERDGVERSFFGGCLGIFGHGNVAGVGQALQEHPQLRYIPARNEQAMVHAAAAYARMHNRLGALVCTTSIGPGATNLVTGAAMATINRLPVLLLPGDIFARRNVAPVLQQLESERSQDVSVNDCLRPVSRYFDRINRAEQLLCALPEALRVLTSPAATGAVTLALPQDVQTEAYDYPEGFFARRVWRVPRPRADVAALDRAAAQIRASKRPLIIAGGGAIYSEATEALERFARATGIPVAETQAGKGALRHDHAQCLGAVGVTGTRPANLVARDADLVIGVGTRYSDFTTASKTAFQHPTVRFVNVNITEFDAAKHAGLTVVGDARAVLEELAGRLGDHRVDPAYAAEIAELRTSWAAEVERLVAPRTTGEGPLAQAEVIGALDAFVADEDVVVNAAGSAPGDLHKLWRARSPKSYHVEYGYSTMGYEIPGALGVKLAAPAREVYAIIGDGSYLMMSSELVTAIQEGIKITVLLVDNHGYASIGALSRSLGSGGFGTVLRGRGTSGALDGEPLLLDFAANAASLGAYTVRARTLGELERALETTRAQDRAAVIVVETDRVRGVPGYESWWDVAVAEVSSMDSVQRARAEYEQARKKERCFDAEER